MGMFDYVFCEYPLPGEPREPDPAKLPFQTKDLECTLSAYRIQTDGQLVLIGDLDGELKTPQPVDYTGEVTMYWDNIVASGPGIYTRDGEEAHRLKYEVAFVGGRVTTIKEWLNERELAAKRKEPAVLQMTDAEAAEADRLRNESLLGRRMYVRWGSINPEDNGYFVKVIAETKGAWVVVPEDDEHVSPAIIHRWSRGSTFFDSKDQARESFEQRAAEWKRETEEYEAEIAGKAQRQEVS